MNWKVRFKNKIFWITIIPALLLLAQRVLDIFGIQFNLTEIQAQILEIVDVVFVILAAIGVVTDMTTSGIGDSSRAMSYKEPYKESK